MYRLETNKLHDTFFSVSNYNDIMSDIQDGVRERTGNNVNPQSKFDLFNLMWSVYSVNSFNYNNDIDFQIRKMNSIVVARAVDQIVSGMLMYKQYVNDISSNPIPNRLPVSTTMYGKKFGYNTKI